MNKKNRSNDWAGKRVAVFLPYSVLSHTITGEQAR